MKIDFYKAVSLIDSYKLMCYPPHYPALYAWDKVKGYSVDKLIKYTKNLKDVGIYVNVPFCPSKCKFCFLDVYEYKDKDKLNKFFIAIEKEIKIYSQLLTKTKISSIYIAGGTVTVLNEFEIEKILKLIHESFNLKNIKQITIETSPDFLNENKLKILKKYNVNLLMLGIQTFDERVIKETNRIQNSNRIKEKIKMIKKFSIPFNVDIICGLSDDISFIKDIKKILELEPDIIHINKIKPIQDPILKSKIENLQKKAMTILQTKGYKKLDEESLTKNGVKNIQGDMNYLTKTSIIGIGPNAMGHIYGKIRYKNYFDLEKYYELLKKGKFGWDKIICIDETDEIDFYLISKIPNEKTSIKTLKKTFKKCNSYLEKKLRFLHAKNVICYKNNQVLMNENKWFELTSSIYKSVYVKKILKNSII